MTIKQKVLFDRLRAFGWEKAETPTEVAPDLEWWQDDVWILESLWAPRDCRVYLSFVVDPQWDGPRQKSQAVWAVAASLEPGNRKEEIRLPLESGWQEELPEFFAELAKLRQEWQRRQSTDGAGAAS